MSKLIEFYSGKEKDNEGRHFSEILKFNHFKLEKDHKFIQWLFPLKEESDFNKEAPLLTEEDIERFKSSNKLKENLDKATALMLHFYGLNIEENSEIVEIEIRRGKNFPIAKENWVKKHNHNHRRIRRILKSLTLLGKERKAEALLRVLKNIAKEEGKINEETVSFWDTAVKEK
jgi:hypothetical protein